MATASLWASWKAISRARSSALTETTTAPSLRMPK